VSDTHPQKLEQPNRTWLASVVFLDIVDYTKQPVANQIAFREHMSNIIAEAIAKVPDEDRLIIDAGDGAALCFLGDPEDALVAAMNLLGILRNSEGTDAPSFKLRIGINLGPVKPGYDVTGRRNVIGDGINVAQRVMSFARPNQILVSRSFYEVIGCLSTEYEQLFQYQGVRKDKHVREHAVYEVKVAGTGRPAVTEVVGVDVDEEALTRPPAPLELPASHHDGAHAAHWDPVELQTAETELTRYIGPVARILVNRASHKVDTLSGMYEALAHCIDDEQDREQFLATGREIAGRAAPGEGAALPPLTPERLKIAEAELANTVGPVARILVKSAAAKATSLDELYALLAEELPTEEAKKDLWDTLVRP
jgi:class 3 adenylate cyclase